MTRGILAGLIATAIVSVLMWANTLFALVPSPGILPGLQSVLAGLSLPSGEAAVWFTHFLIGGVLYGILFVILDPVLPGNGLVEGLLFGVIIWLVTMLVFMPASGHMLFAQDLSGVILWVNLGLHLVYGVILGVIYNAMADEAV